MASARLCPLASSSADALLPPGLDASRLRQYRSHRATGACQEGPDRPGLAQQITRTIADAGINVSGLTGGRMGDRCVFYIRFDRADDLEKAHELIEATL